MQLQANSDSTKSSSFIQRFFIHFFRSFFHLLYHQFAWTYDWVASIVSLGTWQRWGQSVLPFLADTKTLEIGFGHGHLQLALHHKGIVTFGLDESRQMGLITRKRLIKRGFLPNLIRGSAPHLPFASGSFPQVVMTFPTEFFLKPETYLEIKRILLDDGVVLIIPMAWITGHKPLERLIAWVNHITGEAPAWNERYLQPLNRLGFSVTSHMIDFDSSRVLLIRMVKTPPLE
jgi:ubiquinone/menaquinone biosynthesis C-methylase UbiE